MVAVMDVGGVSNCTLGDVKAVQHLTEVFYCVGLCSVY